MSDERKHKVLSFKPRWVRPMGAWDLPAELLTIDSRIAGLLQLLAWIFPFKFGGFDFHKTEGPGFYLAQRQLLVNVLWFGMCFTWNWRRICSHPESMIDSAGPDRCCRRCGNVTGTLGFTEDERFDILCALRHKAARDLKVARDVLGDPNAPLDPEKKLATALKDQAQRELALAKRISAGLPCMLSVGLDEEIDDATR